MSNINTKLEMTATKQVLFEDLNNKDAETVSGGAVEKFTIYNQTNGGRNPYTVDGTRTSRPYGNSEWTTGKGGIIKFDYDYGRSGVQQRTYDLSDGRKYAFRYDTRTSYADDIDLYDIT
ncbi:MAG TPA: hypothetical protein V6C71_00360 [Coleofasciculaceae cyanobacterium]|jgi:hypothetical protein